MRECWVCWASVDMEDTGADVCRGWAEALEGDGEFVDFSVTMVWGSITLEDLCSSKETRFGAVEVNLVGEGGIFVGDGGCSPGNELKKLIPRAGFSRIMSRNRKSSFRFSGLPGRRNSTS